MKTALYATFNPGKVHEVVGFLPGHQISSLFDHPYLPSSKENELQLKDIARGKIQIILDKFKADSVAPTFDLIFADDTALQIDALDGLPGLHARRWAGPSASDEDIMLYTLARMKEKDIRSAKFISCVAYAQAPAFEIHFIMDELKGQILHSASMDAPLLKGFAYDPIFYVTEYGKTLLNLHSENYQIRPHQPTHREKALLKLAQVVSSH